MKNCRILTPSGGSRQTGQTRQAARALDPPIVLPTPFGTLQKRLVQDRLRSIESIDHAVRIRWAAEEASSLAWATGFPFLMFPALFEEQAETAIERARRQEQIRERSRELLGLKKSSEPIGYSS